MFLSLGTETCGLKRFHSPKLVYKLPGVASREHPCYLTAVHSLRIHSDLNFVFFDLLFAFAVVISGVFFVCNLGKVDQFRVCNARTESSNTVKIAIKDLIRVLKSFEFGNELGVR